MAINPEGTLSAVTSHASALGVFDAVNGHEPMRKPGRGITAAFWVQSVGPARGGSGMSSTSIRLAVRGRLYTSLLTKPLDRIDPNLLGACGKLMAAYSSDFTLGGIVRKVDLLGQFGDGLEANAGYLQHDDGTYRIYDINLPLIINDVWEQGA